MIDISNKDITHRQAIAQARVFLKPEVLAAIKEKKIPKGDVLEVARLAAILAAKKTPEIIPLCHHIPIDFVKIEFSLAKKDIKITARVKGRARTGFEMEALTAVAAAALTIYDMCKPLDKDMVISGITLLKKTGGKSGVYIRKIQYNQPEIQSKSK
jgi:cyclic pyranopterin phosphate synthase